jgi:hypothetical protein
MKKITIVLIWVLTGSGLAVPSKKYDSTAILIIDRLLNVISDFKAAAFNRLPSPVFRFQHIGELVFRTGSKLNDLGAVITNERIT